MVVVVVVVVDDVNVDVVIVEVGESTEMFSSQVAGKSRVAVTTRLLDELHSLRRSSFTHFK